MPARSLLVLCCGAFFWAAAPLFAQNTGLVHYGEGGCGSLLIPTWHTGGQLPSIGNVEFKLVSENLIGGTTGFILSSLARANLPILGRALFVGPSPLIALGCQAGGTAGVAGAGAATIPLPIPNDPVLTGSKLCFQAFFQDPTIPWWVSTAKLVHTHGLEATIAGSANSTTSLLHDRQRYQAHLAGLPAAQVDLWCRTAWALNQAPGFTYSKAERFTCGGESHWMMIVRHAQTGLEFCLIPGASFRMGDINGTGLETPVRWVRVKPFLLARTEVPQSTWQAVMGSNPSYWPGPTFPVDGVSWAAAQAFCAGAGLRLPSEAEWECACRAGVDACFHFGENYPSTNLGSYAWFGANSGARTQPVAAKLPNAFGLHDMHGNVSEWCEDTFIGSLSCAPPDERAVGPGGTLRVIRGGSFLDIEQRCRSAHRVGGSIGPIVGRNFGVRPAASLP